MAKPPSRAVDLARQAAEAARAELDETPEAPSLQRVAPWKPESLHGFSLNHAMNQAVHQVANHLARALHYEGLDVNVAPALVKPIETRTNVAEGPLSGTKETDATPGVQVQEGQTGRLVRGYSPGAVLSLFASQHQRNGIVVDGQI